MRINFPTFLTLFRLIFSPLVLPFLLIYLLPLNIPTITISLGIIVILFALTDFFDGYFARRYGQVTSLGKILDPIADKFLIYSTLIALVALHRIYFLWAIIIIGREFFVMGLREVALAHGFSVPVTWMGKLKTVLQLVMITIIIMNPYTPYTNCAEAISIVSALLVTILSAVFYYQEFMWQWKSNT